MTLFQGLLFVHVLGAIVAFGPTFSFPIIGALGGREPEHDNFATRLAERLTRVQVPPLAILQGFTGIGLIIAGGIDLLASYWLLTAIVIDVAAITYAILVQGPAVAKVIALTGGGPPADGAAGGSADVPPSEVVATTKLVQRGGIMLTIMIVTIVFLMVKPF